MNDYAEKHIKDGYFDFASLINDDFVLAIKQLYNAKHYTSALKLLLSFIDSMAFVAYGDCTQQIFKQGLAVYAHLISVSITADQLWRHRNSLLHMSTYESRRVQAGTIAKLVPYVGINSPTTPAQGFRYYSLYDLIQTVMTGTGKYILALDVSEPMRECFCGNYEKIISDSHMVIDQNEA